jgi:nitrate reductase assembly molybdenum cofactor insertion protein NarJ
VSTLFRIPQPAGALASLLLVFSLSCASARGGLDSATPGAPEHRRTCQESGGVSVTLVLPNLESNQELEELVHHAKGLAEAAELVAHFFQELDGVVNTDAEAAATALGNLHAQIFVHLPYHVTGLRKPFSRLFRATCRLADAEERQKELHRKVARRRLGPGRKAPTRPPESGRA